MTTSYYCTIFPFCSGGKKKTTKKQKALYDWSTTGIPVKTINRKKTGDKIHYRYFSKNLCNNSFISRRLLIIMRDFIALDESRCKSKTYRTR